MARSGFSGLVDRHIGPMFNRAHERLLSWEERRNNESAERSGVAAINKGDLAELRQRIAAGGFDLNVKDEYGLTLVEHAISSGKVDCLRLLMDAGANLNGGRLAGGAMISAAHYGQLECLKLLIDRGSDIEARDDKGSTPIMRAAAKGFTPCVRFLIESGSNIHATNKLGAGMIELARETAPHSLAALISLLDEQALATLLPQALDPAGPPKQFRI
jgi:ankyrin repeat protein